MQGTRHGSGQFSLLHAQGCLGTDRHHNKYWFFEDEVGATTAVPCLISQHVPSYVPQELPQLVGHLMQGLMGLFWQLALCSYLYHLTLSHAVCHAGCVSAGGDGGPHRGTYPEDSCLEGAMFFCLQNYLGCTGPCCRPLSGRHARGSGRHLLY